ncbi:motile sperm domain-containing protein 2 [Protopterus annectens]|uniref:motile sperm domain-containing protein 2 n=1 Tax=Protopterus annectens TaxID=7888 RepID=UPI001CFB8ACB|nr:motile sperm domain-containing protein 2 [Protopterus annectens]
MPGLCDSSGNTYPVQIQTSCNLCESSLPSWVLETGSVFLHGYDKEGNKLFWFKVKLHVKDSKTVLERKKYVAFWLERYAKREPGKPLTVVFDMVETGISNIDMDFVRFIINCFKVYYPKYLSKIVIHEMPGISNSAWKLVKSWLGPDAVRLLRFVTRSEVQDYISVEYLPPHMGGIDPFKYSYPPLPDDDFQSPICENGPYASDSEMEAKEETESESKETIDSNHGDESPPRQKKVLASYCFYPSEELHFGSKEREERKCLIVLSNVTKNHVAFKVRTTAPEKYRVKPSNSSCEAGSSVDIIVSLHGGFEASPQDRFLIMAAEMDQSSGTSSSDLSQFWKEVPRSKVMEHRLRCHVVVSNKPVLLPFRENVLNSSAPVKNSDDLNAKLTNLVMANKRLGEQIDRCIWLQQLLISLVCISLTIACYTLYILPTNSQ